MAVLWTAPECDVYIDGAISSLSTTAVLYEQQQISQATEDTDVTINKSTLGGADDCLVVGQSFLPTSPYVEKIVIKCKKTGTPDAGMYIEIYESDDSNLPSGSVIATSATVAVADISASAAEEPFTFTEEDYTRPLTVGNEYVFVVETDATQSDAAYYTLRYKGTASSYASGQLSRSDDDSSFTATSTDDLYFKIRAGTISEYAKDLRITGGERDVEVVKAFGYNEHLDERRATVVEATFTAVYSTKMTQQFIAGIGAAVTGNYWRHIRGETSTVDRTTKSVLIRITDGTNSIHIMLNNARCTATDRSLTADGHMEETFTFKALASNYYEEDDFA